MQEAVQYPMIISCLASQETRVSNV